MGYYAGKGRMKKLREIVSNPSGWDSAQNFLGILPDNEWLFVVAENRDSDTLTRSNFISALSLLGGESENVEVFEYGHWACGWIKYLGVREGSPQEKIASDLLKKLEAYPVVNEDHWSELENDEAQEVWKNCYTNKERLKYIRLHKYQFNFLDFRDLINCVRGHYFCGYASELLT